MSDYAMLVQKDYPSLTHELTTLPSRVKCINQQATSMHMKTVKRRERRGDASTLKRHTLRKHLVFEGDGLRSVSSVILTESSRWPVQRTE